ncbi:hypothetical protein V8F20_006385 [Naviculisporaceae sp. PSN 640]
MSFPVGICIALLGWVLPHLCVSMLIPGHLKSPPKAHPGREPPVELGVPQTAVPNFPPTPTTKAVSSESYIMTDATSETKVEERKDFLLPSEAIADALAGSNIFHRQRRTPTSLGDTQTKTSSSTMISRPTITAPPDALVKRWETVLSGPWVLGGTATVADPADILTCAWTSSQATTWSGITITPGYTMVLPDYTKVLNGLFSTPFNPCLLGGFTEVTTVPSTWTELPPSPAVTTSSTSATSSTSSEVYAYGNGHVQPHQARAEAVGVPKTSRPTTTFTVTATATATQRPSDHASSVTPQPDASHEKRWMTTITNGGGFFGTRTYSKSVPMSFTTSCAGIWTFHAMGTTMSACLALPTPFSDEPSESDAERDREMIALVEHFASDLSAEIGTWGSRFDPDFPLFGRGSAAGPMRRAPSTYYEVTTTPTSPASTTTGKLIHRQVTSRWATLTVTNLNGRQTVTTETGVPGSPKSSVNGVL